MQYLLFASLFLATILNSDAFASDYGDRIATLPEPIAKRLAEASSPNESGAIGRNKQAYFHVRFQRGMHHVADYGLVTKRRDVVQRFLKAVEYSLEHQLPAGDFKLVIPEALENQGKPSVADLTSGIAFFVSSLGLGIHALETNDWFMGALECEGERRRLAKLKPRLELTLAYLLKHQNYLKAADARAPNRLLFDALAFDMLGKILDKQSANDVAVTFVAKALEQVDAKDGYFIEGGGFDSSYNAVATALTLRLFMVGFRPKELRPICNNAIAWQSGRVLESGEVSTQGNARVRPGKSGESFLGKEKDVDIGHVVEAFVLADIALSDESFRKLAMKVIRFYERKRGDRVSDDSA
ncbi:MAG: hypothetical protein AAGG48_28810 [Planctomycetota bacterium]